MATKKSFITFVEDCFKHISNVQLKAMFGEYALYQDSVVVGLICDDRVFIKITESTTALFPPDAEQAPPYKGAKNAFVVPEQVLTDKKWMEKIIVGCGKDVSAKNKKSKKKPA